jgi:uncharacterized protein (UPF0335 family)
LPPHPDVYGNLRSDCFDLKTIQNFLEHLKYPS